MRTIERSSAFKRDYKRAKKTPRHGRDVDSLVSTVVALLLSDQVLPERQVLLARAHADTTEYSRSSSPATGQPSVTGGMTSASCYSARSAVIGSILAARHAGTKAAASATAVRIRNAVSRVSGSSRFTPNSIDSIHRVPTQLATSPITVPAATEIGRASCRERV